jgi:uncharacterized protein (TIGR03435 family)
LTMQRRRERREEAYMQSNPPSDPPEPLAWVEMAPLLDGAMEKLGRKDHDALVLRYFEGLDFKSVGTALGVSEGAAKVRVGRALDKLRQLFGRRGVDSTASVLEQNLSHHSIQAAPAALAKTVVVVALTKGAASASTITLIKGALKLMAWTKAKTVMAAGVAVLLAAGTTTVIVKKVEGKPVLPGAISAKMFPPEAWQVVNPDSDMLRRMPPMLKIVPTRWPEGETSVVGISGYSRRRKWETQKLGISVPVRGVVGDAFQLPGDARTIMHVKWPEGRYDYIDSLTNGSIEALQQAVRKKFGITVRRETVETNVLLLVVKNPNAPGLTVSTNGMGSNSEHHGFRSGDWSLQSHTMIHLASSIENTLAIPVVDHTGNTNYFAIELHWQWKEGESETDAFKQAVLDQLGLDLVPSTAPIEMSIVEPVR